MAFSIGMGTQGGVGNMSPRGGNRGAVIQNTKQLGGAFIPGQGWQPAGLAMNESTNDERTLNADSQFEMANAGNVLKRDIFNRVSPFLGDAFGSASGSFGAVGGQNTPLPQLPNSFVFNDQQTNQMVNAARAQGDQGAQTQRQQLAGSLSGRGFGQNSPLAMALMQGADSTARMGNADQERQIRFGAADRNAQQALGVGQLATTAWNAFNQADIARRQQQLEGYLGNQRSMVSLLGALG